MASGPQRPKQKLVLVDEFCTRAAGSSCSRCEAACPHGAISLENAHSVPSVDYGVCNGCGICFGICDAFASTRMSMFDLHARIKRTAEEGKRVYLTCNENVFPGFEVADNVVVLPCLSMISPELWTLMLAEGVQFTMALDLKYCEDCERAGDIGASLFPRAIEIAEERTGEKVLFTFRIPEKQTLAEKYASNETSDRREVFTGFAADAAEIASGKRRLRNSTVLKDYYERKERQRAAMRLHLASENPYEGFSAPGHVKRLMFPKQQLMLEAIECRPDIAPSIGITLSQTDENNCTANGDCAASCPTKARSLLEDRLFFDPRLCIGCGICVNVCESNACSLLDTTAEALLEEKEN